MTLTYVTPTKRSRMTQSRAARIFLSHNGECWHCHHQIRDGEKWTVEHPDQLSMGGSDDDDDLWPIHLTKCRRTKDARDAGERARRDRIVTASWAGKRKRPMDGSRNSKWKKKMSGQVERRDV